MPRCFQADLHVHTCLSPCADLTMSPKRIVDNCRAKKIDIVAICDHNSAENTKATMNAACNTTLTVIPGMEISSAEEAHVIALLPTYEAAQLLQDLVYDNLATGENDEDIFGEQLVVNEFDEIEVHNKRLLISATCLPISNIVDEIHRLGGIAIASHVDREVYSIIGQLGFIPEGLPLDALEISASTTLTEARKRFPEINAYPLISSSDAHYLDDIGKATSRFIIEVPSLEEIKKALKGIDGRSVAA
jgi:PHP family Zn ribbon phosphoesterase